MAEFAEEKKIPPIDANPAALCYVGMLRELIIARTLKVDNMRADRPLDSLLQEIHTLFLRLVGLTY